MERACQLDDPKKLPQILPGHIDNSDKDTVCTFAAKHGAKKVLRWLFRKRQKYINPHGLNAKGQNAVTVALLHGHLSVARWLQHVHPLSRCCVLVPGDARGSRRDWEWLASSCKSKKNHLTKVTNSLVFLIEQLEAFTFHANIRGIEYVFPKLEVCFDGDWKSWMMSLARHKKEWCLRLFLFRKSYFDWKGSFLEYCKKPFLLESEPFIRNDQHHYPRGSWLGDA